MGLELAYQQQVWEQHPSRLPDQPRPPASELNPSAQQQFQQYALRRQQQTRHLPLCPACQCPTPRGELERWGCCALCTRHCWSP
jgi:predicted nucleic acid-binding Zn ribbon protein